MFKVGEKMSYYGEEVGVINGTYLGPFIANLHQFRDCKGKLCAGAISDMKAGHAVTNKGEWH